MTIEKGLNVKIVLNGSIEGRSYLIEVDVYPPIWDAEFVNGTHCYTNPALK